MKKFITSVGETINLFGSCAKTTVRQPVFQLGKCPRTWLVFEIAYFCT